MCDFGCLIFEVHCGQQETFFLHVLLELLHVVSIAHTHTVTMQKFMRADPPSFFGPESDGAYHVFPRR
jgi:hypothetical protein